MPKSEILFCDDVSQLPTDGSGTLAVLRARIRFVIGSGDHTPASRQVLLLFADTPNPSNRHIQLFEIDPTNLSNVIAVNLPHGWMGVQILPIDGHLNLAGFEQTTD